MNNVNKVKPIIRNALLNLLKDHKLYEITIKDVVLTANISRASFYRNYNSLTEVVEDFYKNVFNCLDLHNNENIKKMIKIINDNRETFTLLSNRKCLCYLSNLSSDPYLCSIFSIISSWISNDFIECENEILNSVDNLDFLTYKDLKIEKETQNILSVKTMRDSDAHTISNGVPSKELMMRAAKGIYNSYSWRGKVAIICGKGNNAGDGYALALLLQEQGIDLTIFRINESLSEDGKFYFEKCLDNNIKVEFINEHTSLNAYDIIVDCIFGTGFKGEVKEPYRTIINKINDSKAEVISADINSGLNGDNGLCDIAVKSSLTVSIGSLKPGLYLNKAKDYTKKVINADIGIKPIDINYKLLGNDDVNKCLPKRDNFSNKGTYGYIALIGGSKRYSGAIRLANLAASSSKMGAGVITLAMPQSLSNVVSQHLLESTAYPLEDKDGSLVFNKEQLDELIKRNKTIAIGMGLGVSKDIEQIIEYLLLNYEGNLIIDADGLNALSKLDSKILDNSKAKVILTPHIKEFSRLTSLTVDEILSNPCELAKEYAKRHSVIVLLKGPATIVSDGNETLLVNRGCAGMATAGSGDVLSGILASIVSYNNNHLYAVASGVYVNGLAGELAQKHINEISMTSVDTINYISKAINCIKNNY